MSLSVGLASPEERALIEHLFESKDYNPLIRPVQNLNQTIEVGFEMALIQLINLVSRTAVADPAGSFRCVRRTPRASHASLYKTPPVKPRLHDTAACQTGCKTGLTTGCIV